jgi:nucleoside-diphosphate-sugar epimerase
MELGRMTTGPTVVTGGSGYVGTNLVLALRAAGRPVRVVDLRQPAVSDPDVTWIQADVRDRAAMRQAFAGADIGYHLAAVISLVGGLGGRVESVNVGGVRVVAEAARKAGVRRLVHCSSVHAFDAGAVAGARAGAPVTEDCPRADDPRLPAYDRSKAAGEAALRAVVARGLDAVVVNPTGILGPRDDGPSRIGAGLYALWRRRLPATVAGGFDWVDVRDVVHGLLAAETHGRTGESYLLPGHRCSVRDLLVLAAGVGGVPVPPAVPLWSLRPVAPLATAVGRRWPHPMLPTTDMLHTLRTFPYVDGTKAATELGYRPRPLAETVRDLYESFRSAGGRR